MHSSDIPQGQCLYAAVNMGPEWIDLITPDHFAQLPDDTELVSFISGQHYRKAQITAPRIRKGFTEYGLPGSGIKRVEIYSGPFRDGAYRRATSN